MFAHLRLLISLLAIPVVACGLADPRRGSADEGDPAPAPSSPPPTEVASRRGPPVLDAVPHHALVPSAGSLCVFSADCAPGEHCDLGECVAACDETTPCSEGKTCSPRGRCLGPAEADEDPPPVTERIGTLAADPASVLLTERDDEFVVRLTADSNELVEYRVQLDAPHLAFPEPRGEFFHETTLRFPVDTERLQGTDSPGSIKIVTNLGSLVVEAPARVGVTGAYEGAMSYQSGGLPLGTVGIALELYESKGDIVVKVDSERSMLLPGGPSGRGSFTHSEGVTFSVSEVFPPEFGGDRNHFRRPLGRELVVSLRPSDRGTLEGTFEEKLHGLFAQPVILTGTVQLERRALVHQEPPPASPDVDMPQSEATALPRLADVFSGWSDGEDCPSLGSETILQDAYDIAVATYLPFSERVRGVGSGTADPIGDLASDCAEELASPGPLHQPRCAVVPCLASALRDVAAHESVGPGHSSAFGSLFANTLDPPLLVAQDHLVRAMKESFSTGLTAERSALDQARAVLREPALWVLHPAIMAYLAHSTGSRAPLADESGEAPNVRALRTLARLFYVLSTIDGEASNLAAADRMLAREERIRGAQERGVLALFEAATVSGVLGAWGESAPPNVGNEFIDVLSPLDQGFRTLLQGTLVFGVPEGFIPFLHLEGSRESNFDRVLASVKPRLERFIADEVAFLEASRTYEQNAAALDGELEAIHTNLEGQIADICGSAFTLAEVGTDLDWAACGTDDAGEVGSLLLGVRQAQERLRSAHGRITSMGDKIEIERSRIESVKGVRDGTIRFIDQQGDHFDELRFQEGVLTAAQKALEVASNGNLWNAGASVGMGVAAALFESQKTMIDIQRQQLQRAQEMQIRADDSEVEVLNGMAAIQTLTVDMSQLNLEMQQEVLGVLQAQVSVKNAVERARRLVGDRARALSRVAKSPFGDPTFRILQDRQALMALRSRREAQRALYVAGRALEYHLNQPFDEALGKAVFNVSSAGEAGRLEDCLEAIYGDAGIELAAPQPYVTELSLRKLLGIDGPRTDGVSGEELDPGEQLRHLLLRNENLDGGGSVGVQISMNLQPGNGLWQSNVCDDKITTIEAELVGDFLGDSDATVELSLEGGGVLRRCDRDELVNWSTDGNAVVQAGVNTFGSAGPNGSLRGRSVASALWRVSIPGPDIAPANADLDIEKIDDVVLRVGHEARPIRASATPVSLTCLSDVGAGR